VQKISGIEYEQYIVDNVLKPLGVTTPHPVYPSPEMVERMALPYGLGVRSANPRRWPRCTSTSIRPATSI
jgi:CubicO group peptidase (beta-lactamase class C family)